MLAIWDADKLIGVTGRNSTLFISYYRVCIIFNHHLDLFTRSMSAPTVTGDYIQGEHYHFSRAITK